MRHAFSAALRALFALAVLLWPAFSSAQQQQQQPVPAFNPLQGALRTGTVPTDFYLNIFPEYYDGRYDDALRDFISEGRGAIKTAQSNWIDSICYHTMAGECQYQMGQLSQALAHYNSAVQLYVAFYDWLIRVQFPPMIQAANPGQLRVPPWGRRQRASRIGLFQDDYPTLQGQVDNSQALQRSTVVQMAQLFPIRATEILRCTALAIKRRGEILGPLAEHDSLGKEALAAIARRPTQPNHWSEAFIDAQLGIAYLAIGKIDQAQPVLERAAVAAGEFDHPLTAMVLVELGRVALLKSDFQTAATCFEEATYAAYQFGDVTSLEEAFRYGLTAHLLSGKVDPYPPLLTAATWAKANNLRQLHVSLLLLAAENAAALGQTKQAQDLVDNARTMSANRIMLRGRIGARMNYVRAVVSYQAGQIDDGDTALINLLDYERNGSHWLYQISTADSMYQEGSLSPRAALLTYQRLLREPDAFDWGYDPIESLAVLSTGHSQSYENWFVTCLERDKEAAFAVADEVRRHRFLSTLPVGGRLLGLRWVLGAPADLLDRVPALDRQALTVKYPAYDQLTRQAQELRNQLSQLPLVSDEPASRENQAQLVSQLAAVSDEQERLIREMAVRRNPGSLIFPPKRSLKNVQASLSDGQAVLAFLTTNVGVYGFLITPTDYDIWPVEAPATIHRMVATLLRDMGHTEANRELSQEVLANQKWKRAAAELFNTLTRNTRSKFPEGITELVIVPDRSLWYVPFAALQMGPQSNPEPLISKIRLRFAPTTGLAVGDSRGLKRQMNTLVALGRLFPRDDPAVAEAAYQQIAQAIPGALALRGKPPAPSCVFSSVVDRLIVYDEIDPGTNDAYAWSPFQTDQGSPGSSLGDWMLFPWGAPDQVILPGYHSSSANSLKGRAVEVAGDDLFLNILGLMASGSRTILISQWRAGGQSTYDLMREFIQELPHTTAADAWQRSVALTMDAPLNPEAEARVGRGKNGDTLKGEHPLFWAGYLLIDPGPTGQKPDEPQVGVALNAPAAGADKNEAGGGSKPAVQLGGAPVANDPADAPVAGEGGAMAPIGGFAGDEPQAEGKKPRKRPSTRTPRSRRQPKPAAEAEADPAAGAPVGFDAQEP